jgi:RNA polymerase primary sigma factor
VAASGGAASHREKQLLAETRRGDHEARDRLVEEHMGLVRSVARRYRELGLPFEDLVQEGAIGLLEAIERFDPDNGAKFSTYAYWRIRQAVTHALTAHGRLLHLPKGVLERRRAIWEATEALVDGGPPPTALALAHVTGLSAAEVIEALAAPVTTTSLDKPLGEGLSLGAVLADPTAADPEAATVSELERVALVDALARLPDRQRLVINAHFGLDGEPKTLAELGAALSVSTGRVRAIERDALHDLAVALEPTLAEA